MATQTNTADRRQETMRQALTVEQYQHLLDSLLTVVFILDADARFLYINGTSRNVWGYAPEELLGASCYELIVEKDREKTMQYLKDQKTGVLVVHFQNMFCKKDRSLVTVSWVANWDEKEQLHYCVVRDITEREKQSLLPKPYNNNLVKQNQTMASILERITDGFCALDKDWRVLYWNMEAEWMLGKPRGSVLGKNIWKLFPEAVDTDLHNQLHKAIKEQLPVYFENYYAAREIWSEVTVYPSPYGLLVFFKNINERKRLVKELREQQRQMTSAVIVAQEKERSLISKELHDNVNQLLTSAKLYAGLGRDRVHDSTAMVDKTVCLLQNAIDEIRKLSKRLSDPFIDDMDLDDSIKELLETFRRSDHLHITISLEHKKNVHANGEVKLAVYRILQEHLTNIVKHAAASLVEVSLKQAKEKVTLVVTDNGKGFDTTKHYEGIGLANMRSRAESLRGNFTLESEEGKGTKLLVEIPMDGGKLEEPTK